MIKKLAATITEHRESEDLCSHLSLEFSWSAYNQRAAALIRPTNHMT
jgi:hypothetical protein